MRLIIPYPPRSLHALELVEPRRIVDRDLLQFRIVAGLSGQPFARSALADMLAQIASWMNDTGRPR